MTSYKNRWHKGNKWLTKLLLLHLKGQVSKVDGVIHLVIQYDVEYMSREDIVVQEHSQVEI